MDPNPMESPRDIATYARKVQEQRLYQLLLAVDERYADTKKDILKRDPRPSVETAYNELRRAEIQNGVLIIIPSDPRSSSGVGYGLVVKPPTDNKIGGTAGSTAPRSGVPSRRGREDKYVECSHCKRKGHSKDKCFKLNGYPDWWDDFKKKGQASVAQSTGDSHSGNRKASDGQNQRRTENPEGTAMVASGMHLSNEGGCAEGSTLTPILYTRLKLPRPPLILFPLLFLVLIFYRMTSWSLHL